MHLKNLIIVGLTQLFVFLEFHVNTLGEDLQYGKFNSHRSTNLKMSKPGTKPNYVSGNDCMRKFEIDT